MIAFVEGNSQNFTLPTPIIDSLIFEVKKGRECKSLQAYQQDEIFKLNNELLASYKVIKLKDEENKALSSIIEGFDSQIEKEDQQHKLEKKTLKSTIRKLWVAVITEAGVVTLLIIILL